MQVCWGLKHSCLLADHEPTASICMGPIGLGKEEGKRVLYCGKQFCIQERPGWYVFWNLLENCSNLPVVVSLLVLSVSPDTPHYKQNRVLDKNAPDPLGPSIEMNSPNSCFLQLHLMFNFCRSIGLSLSYQVAITNHCWADWNQICNDGARRARPLPRR